jgi:mono/diheme cytochrome c family protein
MFITAVLLGLTLAGCGVSPLGTTGTTGVATPLDGAALYATNCAGCHGPLATSTKSGATLARIQTAIVSNAGGMSFLSALTSDQLQAIATALSPGVSITTAQIQTVAATLTPVQLQTLSTALTMSPSATGDVTIGALQIQSLVSSLTPLQIQAIAATLNPDQVQAITAAVFTPTAIPAGSGTGNVIVTASQVQAVTAALLSTGTAGVTVTPTQVQAVAATLTPNQIQALTSSLSATPAAGIATVATPATPDGAALYAANCAGCHGPLATSTKLGSNALLIQTGIGSNTGGMGFLSALTTADIEAIATTLGAP